MPGDTTLLLLLVSSFVPENIVTQVYVTSLGRFQETVLCQRTLFCCFVRCLLISSFQITLSYITPLLYLAYYFSICTYLPLQDFAKRWKLQIAQRVSLSCVDKARASPWVMQDYVETVDMPGNPDLNL